MNPVQLGLAGFSQPKELDAKKDYTYQLNVSISSSYTFSIDNPSCTTYLFDEDMNLLNTDMASAALNVGTYYFRVANPSSSSAQLNVNIVCNHVHVFCEYINIGKGQHSRECACGYEIKEYHNGDYSSLGVTSGHKGTCTKCGFSGTEAHSWIKSGIGDSFVCAICGQVSKNIQITFPENVSMPLLAQNETISINGALILFSDNTYYLLVDPDTVAPATMTWEQVANIFNITETDMLQYIKDAAV